MTSYQLEAFCVLASCMSYRKASEILFMTQPNMSKIVSALEQELGVQLVKRTSREVKLTPAGEAFHRHAQSILDQLSVTIEDVHKIDAGIKGIIKLGYLGTALIDSLPSLIKTFRDTFPEILLQPVDYTYSALIAALINDEVDIAIVPDLELQELPGLNVVPFFYDDICLAVSKDHPLAERKTLEFDEVKNQPFIEIAPDKQMRDYKYFPSLPSIGQYKPKTVAYTNTLINLLCMVGAGYGVSLLARHMARFASDNVRFINMVGGERAFRISCLWKEGRSTHVENFVKLVNSLI